jgi:hypothetical protein
MRKRPLKWTRSSNITSRLGFVHFLDEDAGRRVQKMYKTELVYYPPKKNRYPLHSLKGARVRIGLYGAVKR